jgi:hypothetical protein
MDRTKKESMDRFTLGSKINTAYGAGRVVEIRAMGRSKKDYCVVDISTTQGAPLLIFLPVSRGK